MVLHYNYGCKTVQVAISALTETMIVAVI